MIRHELPPIQFLPYDLEHRTFSERRLFLENPANATKQYYQFLNHTNATALHLGTFTEIIEGLGTRDYRIRFSSGTEVEPDSEVFFTDTPLVDLPNYTEFRQHVSNQLVAGVVSLFPPVSEQERAERERERAEERAEYERERAEERRRNAHLPPPPVVNPPPQLPQPVGIAYEVHRHFDNLDYEKFMGIIRHEITPVTSGNEILEPLIDYARSNYTEKVDQLVGINNTVNMYSNKDIRAIQDVIKFVLGQPDNFKNTYIDVFVKDCLEAYPFNSMLPEANRKSCIKGQYERVFLSMNGTINVLCLGMPCPPLYKELLKCFKPDYNAFFREWFLETQDVDKDKYSDMEKEEKVKYIEAKKAELRAFIVERLGFEIESIDEYLNGVVKGKNPFIALYESFDASGRRKRKQTNKRKGKSRKNKKSKKMKKRKGKK